LGRIVLGLPVLAAPFGGAHWMSALSCSLRSLPLSPGQNDLFEWAVGEVGFDASQPEWGREKKDQRL